MTDLFETLAQATKPEKSEEILNITLKPCPFCGGKASSDGKINYGNSLKPKHKQNAWHEDGTPIDEMYFCNCVSCGSSNKGILGHSAKEIAIKAWNTRAAERLAKIDVLETVRNDIVYGIEGDPQNEHAEGVVKGSWDAISDIDSILSYLKADN